MRDPAEVDWTVVETATPQPYPAVIPAHDLAALRASLAAAQAQRDQVADALSMEWQRGEELRASRAAAQADAALWQGKYMELREIVLLVEDFADNRDAATQKALIDAFNAFRVFVEGGKPRTWLVAEPGDAGAGADSDTPWRTGIADPEDDASVPWG